MKEYQVCTVAFSYGVSLCKARRLTEEEKKHYAEQYRDKGFVSTSESIALDELNWGDIKVILHNRPDDGSFRGCSNVVYIVSSSEWDELIQINQKKLVKKRQEEIREDIKECRKIIAACEKQEKLYTQAEAKIKGEQYNKMYNEGGEGYVPHYYTQDDYEFYKEKLKKLENEYNK